MVDCIACVCSWLRMWCWVKVSTDRGFESGGDCFICVLIMVRLVGWVPVWWSGVVIVVRMSETW